MFWQLMVDLSRQDKVTIFISTHFMNEAERCDRMSLMHAGGYFKLLNGVFNSIKVFRPKKTHRRLYNRTIHQSQMSEDVVRI
ncbi:hypothetical protein ONK27_26980, partial [Salmonella enterica subsp. enterica serovar Virginia]|nr:hypothetical protein [Salmonella enterica subsp. enterica serovar Virginia]